MNLINRGFRYAKKKLLPGHAPDFLIVGAQKSGTTSLHFYLAQHPNLLGSRPKEVGYFHKDENFQKGKRWYHHFFKNIHGKKNYLCFESTPENLYLEKAARRIKDEYPAIKIIIILRNPIERAYSAWNMYREFIEKNIKQKQINNFIKKSDTEIIQELFNEKEFPSFETLIEKELEGIKNRIEFSEPSILRRGLYYEQVKRYIELFGKENVIVLGFKDFVQNKVSVLNRVLSFLHLPESDWMFLNGEKRHSFAYNTSLDTKMEAFLKEYYRLENEKLFSLIGYELNW
ncbi:MAG: sulfotransferase [Ginsengibacter sp.]